MCQTCSSTWRAPTRPSCKAGAHHHGTGRHLRRHWEQQHFVTHRLKHYRAGLRMDYATTSAGDLAGAMRTALTQNATGPGYRPIPRGGEHRAAEHRRLARWVTR
jgi:hypothetical protein